MKYVFVDTDNGGAPSNVTPDTSTSKYHTSSAWPANGARWSSLNAVFADATIRGITDDLTVYCVGVADDTAQVIIGTSMTCASLLVQGDVSSAQWDANKYTIAISGTSQHCIDVTFVGNVTIDKIQFANTGTNSAPHGIRFEPASGTAIYIAQNCHGRISGSGASAGFCYRQSNAVSVTAKFLNCIGQQTGSPGGTRTGMQANTSATTTVYNCVFEGFNGAGAIGIQNADTVKNCAVFNCTDNFSGGTMSYCASDDGDGTNAQTAVTWANEFVDYANGDFKLKAGGTKLQGTGIGPSSDANVPSTDIAGVTRSGTTTDIGAAMFVPTGLTITSVNTTNTAFSAQTDSAVIGTGLSASVVCTYAGIACTNESASSSTSLKITFPNFFTNNIKLGRNYEFKVVG